MCHLKYTDNIRRTDIVVISVDCKLSDSVFEYVLFNVEQEVSRGLGISLFVMTALSDLFEERVDED
jgi:hypothetical protein